MPAGPHGSARTASFRSARAMSGIACGDAGRAADSGAGTTAGIVPALPPTVSTATRALASAPVRTRVRRRVRDAGGLRVGVREEPFQHRAIRAAGIASPDQFRESALQLPEFVELLPYAVQVPLAQCFHIRTRRAVAR